MFDTHVPNNLIEKLQKIKLVLTDVDGVLTDGGLYYDNSGLVMKKFNVKDGMAVRLLRDAGIESGIISSDISEMIIKRAERLEISYCYTGVWDKEEKLFSICSELGINTGNVAFIGDDINDLRIIDKVGFSACPSDAVFSVRQCVNHICNSSGGKGVFREIAELVLSAQNK